MTDSERALLVIVSLALGEVVPEFKSTIRTLLEKLKLEEIVRNMEDSE